jgi:hypothetical protein
MSTVSFKASRPVTNPAVLQAARDIADLELLAFYRALAASTQPQQFSMPANATSSEQRYARLIAKRSSASLKSLAVQSAAALAQPRAGLGLRMSRFGAVNHLSPLSVREQVKATWKSNSLAGAISALKLPAPGARPVVIPTDVLKGGAKPGLTQLTVHVKQLLCIHESGDNFFEPDPDAIDMAGAVFDVTRIGAAGGVYSMGRNFRTGTRVSYDPALLLGSINIPAEGPWPKVFRGVVLLIERDDAGSISDDVQVIFEQVRDAVATEVGKLVGEVASAYLGSGLGQLAGELFEEALKAVANGVMRAIDSDVFPVQSFELQIPDAGALADAQPVTRQLSFATDGGSYSMDLLADWRRITMPILQRRVNQLALSVATGRDSLRSNSQVWVRVNFADGSASPEVNLRSVMGNQNPDEATVRQGMLRLPSQREVREIQGLSMRFEGRNDWPESDDHWHVQRVTVTTDGPDPAVTLIDANGGGGLIKVLTKSDANWSAAVNHAALRD